ncbi:hypothetical protein LDO51_11500 [Providencia alcalifaciens]|uniref:hypothetical protein n=1 Tax=Providencia alcalifaciens TaxID=126385 RepID=UPI001CE1EF16|nr:hypothetical protein [Providencia alcalifaciens]UBX47815.1 hypothetical protein LDO51_11500 [Providencia alcalifaciens]
MAISKGLLSIENLWNEDLKKVEISFKNNANEHENIFIFYNLMNGKKLSDITELTFSSTEQSYWMGIITTKSGEIWSSIDYLACKLNEKDNGKVTLSFNRNSRHMFLHYPVSTSCSAPLLKI